MQKCEKWNRRLKATLDVKLALPDGAEQLESFCQVAKLKAESYEFVYQIPDCGTLKELRWHLNNEGIPCVCSVNVSDDTGKTVFTRCVGESERTEMGDVLISGEAYYLILGKGLEGKQLKICVKVHLFNVQEAIDFIKKPAGTGSPALPLVSRRTESDRRTKTPGNESSFCRKRKANAGAKRHCGTVIYAAEGVASANAADQRMENP